MSQVNIYEAKAHLSELVQRAAAGEEIVIARNGKPAARLVPLAPQATRQPGGWAGRVWLAPDFETSDDAVTALMLADDDDRA